MERFGRYVLLECIGTGGMAEVFRAVAIGRAGFSRQVAVKRILPHLTRDGTVVAMLIEEANLAAGLQHPNIVNVIDFGQEGSSYFIAMDYIAGQTLAQILSTCCQRSVRFPMGLAAHVVAQALRGLAYAHDKKDAQGEPMGIVHRDISPDNILVGYSGQVYLVDFGVAKAAARVRLTLAGSLKGKPAYMCPEVVRGEPITQAVDLYAMGVVLFEALALQPMRPPLTDLQMLNEVAKGEVPRFEQRGAQVPPSLANVVYTALDPNPESRFSNATVFGYTLDTVLKTLGEPASPAALSHFMSQLFAEDIAAEAAKQAQFLPLMRKLATAKQNQVIRILDRARAGKSLHGGVFTPPLMWVLSGVVAAGVGGASWWWMRVPPAVVANADAGSQTDGSSGAPTRVLVPVDSTPAHALVQLGELRMGRTPVEIELAENQRVRLTVQERGFVTWERELDGSAPPTRIHAELTPVESGDRANPRTKTTPVNPSRNTAPGLLSLQSKPWARILVDGKETGEFTPVTDLPLAPGKRTITLINDEFDMRTSFDLLVRPGERIKESRSLK